MNRKGAFAHRFLSTGTVRWMSGMGLSSPGIPGVLCDNHILCYFYLFIFYLHHPVSVNVLQWSVGSTKLSFLSLCGRCWWICNIYTKESEGVWVTFPGLKFCPFHLVILYCIASKNNFNCVLSPQLSILHFSSHLGGFWGVLTQTLRRSFQLNGRLSFTSSSEQIHESLDWKQLTQASGH